MTWRREGALAPLSPLLSHLNGIAIFSIKSLQLNFRTVTCVAWERDAEKDPEVARKQERLRKWWLKTKKVIANSAFNAYRYNWLAIKFTKANFGEPKI